jgi:phage gp36-like protein
MTHMDSTPPISYSVDNALGVIFEVWHGEITASDLRRHWEDYLSDPTVLALRRTLVDLRAATIRFTGNELSNLISYLVIPVLKGQDWLTAILVEQPVQFGVSRQYQVFAERYSTDSIFHDYDEALLWLRRQAGKNRTGVAAQGPAPAVASGVAPDPAA